MTSLREDEYTHVIYREWKSPSPKLVLLLVHGLGAHSARWEFLAEFFIRNNISSYAIELKGFGETKTAKGHIDSFNIYFDDISSLRHIIRKENPGNKVFLVGESLGAIISFLLAASNPELFDGLVCISPVFRSRLKFNISDYIMIFLSFLYNPKRQFEIPFDSTMCTRDVDYRIAMDMDEREIRFASSSLLANTGLAQMRANIIKNKVTVPLLFLLAGDDKIVDPKASKAVFGALKLKDKALIEYPEMYHALSIDEGREKVFTDILDWVQSRI